MRDSANRPRPAGAGVRAELALSLIFVDSGGLGGSDSKRKAGRETIAGTPLVPLIPHNREASLTPQGSVPNPHREASLTPHLRRRSAQSRPNPFSPRPRGGRNEDYFYRNP
jgi:hypothetical protein